MDADYLAKVAAIELGAGGVLDTVKGVCDAIPDGAKQVSGTMQIRSARLSQLSGNKYCRLDSHRFGKLVFLRSILLPDAPGPMVIVTVTNPDDVLSDPVSINVSDTAGLFRSLNTVYVPALKPVIRIELEEDYSKVCTSGCRSDHVIDNQFQG